MKSVRNRARPMSICCEGCDPRRQGFLQERENYDYARERRHHYENGRRKGKHGKEYEELQFPADLLRAFFVPHIDLDLQRQQRIRRGRDPRNDDRRQDQRDHQCSPCPCVCAHRGVPFYRAFNLPKRFPRWNEKSADLTDSTTLSSLISPRRLTLSPPTPSTIRRSMTLTR